MYYRRVTFSCPVILPLVGVRQTFRFLTRYPVSLQSHRVTMNLRLRTTSLPCHSPLPTLYKILTYHLFLLFPILQGLSLVTYLLNLFSHLQAKMDVVRSENYLSVTDCYSCLVYTMFWYQKVLNGLTTSILLCLYLI